SLRKLPCQALWKRVTDIATRFASMLLFYCYCLSGFGTFICFGLGIRVDQTDVAVTRPPRTGRDQLTDDDVLLKTEQLVDLAFNRGVGKYPRRLLEGRGRQERIGFERCFRDTEKHRLSHRRLAAVKERYFVRFFILVNVDE